MNFQRPYFIASLVVLGAAACVDRAQMVGAVGKAGVAPPTPVVLAPTTARTSITSQNGITWNFNSAQAGQFANGDWFVVGPVTVTSISPSDPNPQDSTDINGSMLNPTGCTQGYDNRSTAMGSYSRPKNFARTLPQVVQPGTSIVSTISASALSGIGQAVDHAAVLTVLGSAPPLGAFRPPYAGVLKDITHKESDLDYSKLASFSPPSSAPSLASTAATFRAMYLDHCDSGGSRRIFHQISDGMGDYYRDRMTQDGVAALLLNASYSAAQKRDLLVNFVQQGIDSTGDLSSFLASCDHAGHCLGKKFLITFAGKVLNDPSLRDVGINHPTVFLGPTMSQNTWFTSPSSNGGGFPEDILYFMIQETSPGIVNWGFPFNPPGTNIHWYGPGPPREPYTSADVGKPEWGNEHAGFLMVDPYIPAPGPPGIENDNASWDPNVNPYRLCCMQGIFGPALAMEMMGLTGAWNQPVLFKYIDRYMAKTRAYMQGANPYGIANWHVYWDDSGFTQYMWEHYRSQLPASGWQTPSGCGPSNPEAC